MSLPSKPVIEHAPDDLMPGWMMAQRTRVLVPASDKTASSSDGDRSAVVYWMQRDVRARHNWALLWAQHLAQKSDAPLHVVYALPPPGSGRSDGGLPPALVDMQMTERHGMFLLGGLEHVHQELFDCHIPLHVVMAPAHDKVGESVCETVLDSLQAGTVVTDMSPIRQYREWMELQAAPVLSKSGKAFYQVDTHNCVPVWAASNKREYGARTIRPRIHKQVSDFLQEFPELQSMKGKVLDLPKFNRKEYEAFLEMDSSVPELDWAKPGTDAGLQQFASFCKTGLKDFDALRNDPTKKNIISNMSPWYNHGHVSFQHVLMEVKSINKYANGTKAYVEEGLIRRELSDNYCFYVPNDYDSLDAAYGWARETLQQHAHDKREHVYSLEQLEQAMTYDDLWNAAQLQLVRDGKLHGFMRMYWAKKVLEWSESPEFALRAAQFFNDKYAVDGRDPNGFVGVGWSIMGIHDQGWKEREIFGKIRYMNYNGCKRKFDVSAFVQAYEGAAENAKAASESDGQKRAGRSDNSSRKKQKVK